MKKNLVSPRIVKIAALTMIIFGVLTFSGLLNVFAIARFATVNYVDIWGNLSPGSTDIGNPDIITAGQSIALTATLTFADDSIGWISNPQLWFVTVDIYATQKIQTVSLQWTGEYGDFVDFVGSWTVVQTENVVYTFKWTVDTVDSGKTSKTTYAKTPLLEPDGTFYVNGYSASSSTHIVLVDPALAFRFVPSRASDKITGVNVKILSGTTLLQTVALAKQTDGSYTGNHTLSATGTFEVQGYVEWNQGGAIRKMNLLLDWASGDGGDGGGDGGLVVNLNHIAGAVAAAVGVMLLLWKPKSEKAS